jgi:hypothetical protein
MSKPLEASTSTKVVKQLDQLSDDLSQKRRISAVFPLYFRHFCIINKYA